MYIRYIFIVFFAFILIPPLSAAAGQEAQRTTDGAHTGYQNTHQNAAPSVAQAEGYLRSLGTAQARFLQTAPNGTQVAGTFYLNRPGRLRFEYDAPIEDFIVADGLFIYFYDSELGEQSNAPIGRTLADFLLRADLRLGGDVEVIDVRRRSGLLHITLRQADDPGAGSLTLGFTEQPMALKRWRVTDATGSVTEIELFDLQTGIDLPGHLFAYRNPQPRGYNE